MCVRFRKESICFLNFLSEAQSFQPVKARLILFVSLLMAGSSLAHAQLDFAYFHVDTLGIKPAAVLPNLYFKKYRRDILPTSLEDLAYIVRMLEKYPEMQIRLHCDGQMRRFDFEQRRLNRRRMRMLVKILRNDYEIDKKRIIVIDREAWNYRSGKDPEPHSLNFRRITCDAVWPPQRRTEEPEKLEPAEKPTERLELFPMPVDPGEVEK